MGSPVNVNTVSNKSTTNLRCYYVRPVRALVMTICLKIADPFFRSISVGIRSGLKRDCG